MTRDLDRNAGWRLVLLALCVAGCERAPVNPRVLRLGFFPNVTHGVALSGTESGRFARGLAPIRLEPRVFNAGPAAMEALLSGALDAVYIGPSPALQAWNATRGHGLRVVAGAASGGTVFVVRPGAGIHSPGDFHGKRLATPQLGNTQDVALRSWLRAHGLETTERGGDVSVIPLGNSEILGQFRLGHLDGAWVPEPWATRLVREAHATVFLDERDLWPNRRFPITLLAVSQRYLDQAPASVDRLLRAHLVEVAHLREDPAAGRAEVNRALARWQGRALPVAVLEEAWARIEFTADAMEPALQRSAEAGHALEFLRTADIRGLVQTAPLERAGGLTVATASP